MNEWRRWGFGAQGVSYAVSPEIARTMRGVVEVTPTSERRAESIPSSLPSVSVASPEVRVDVRGVSRDARGRILSSSPQIPGPDERMPEQEVRDRLRALYGQSPRGSLGPLARLFGYRSNPRQSLRTVAKGTGVLPEAMRRRISRVLLQIERGEVVCRETEGRKGNYPVYVWEVREKPRQRPDSINARKA